MRTASRRRLVCLTSLLWICEVLSSSSSDIEEGNAKVADKKRRRESRTKRPDKIRTNYRGSARSYLQHRRTSDAASYHSRSSWFEMGWTPAPSNEPDSSWCAKVELKGPREPPFPSMRGSLAAWNEGSAFIHLGDKSIGLKTEEQQRIAEQQYAHDLELYGGFRELAAGGTGLVHYAAIASFDGADEL
ncbi:unnamed protein product [Amoebophrya sp. A25]|nr:unnamed protein product [Amoebophrya sp. A25]|eukprot:GSA25T00011744001.1